MGACCETEEEAQRLTTEHTLTRHRADVQEIRKSDYTLVTSSSVPALPIISPLPVPQRDRTLNSYLADSMPGSFQEASYLAPTAMEEELERYEAVVNNTIQDLIDLSQLNQESMATFLSVHDKLQVYRESTEDDGCLRQNIDQPSDLIPAILCPSMQVTTGADVDPVLTSEAAKLVVPKLINMSVKDCGPLLASLTDEEDQW